MNGTGKVLDPGEHHACAHVVSVCDCAYMHAVCARVSLCAALCVKEPLCIYHTMLPRTWRQPCGQWSWRLCGQPRLQSSSSSRAAAPPQTAAATAAAATASAPQCGSGCGSWWQRGSAGRWRVQTTPHKGAWRSGSGSLRRSCRSEDGEALQHECGPSLHAHCQQSILLAWTSVYSLEEGPEAVWQAGSICDHVPLILMHIGSVNKGHGWQHAWHAATCCNWCDGG